MAYPIDDPTTADSAMKAAFKSMANELDVPTTISANTTLDSTHYGKILYVDTTSVALTFPAAPATTQVIRVYNGSAGNITVNSVTVGSGKDILYISVGSAWKRFQPSVVAGGTLLPAPQVGQWVPAAVGPVATGAVVTASKIYFCPFVLPYDMTVDQVAVQVATAAGTNLGLAFYADTFGSSVHSPTGAAIASGTSVVSSASTGWKSVALAASYTFLQGVIYWQAFCCDGAAALKVESGMLSMGIVGSTLASGVPVAMQGYSWATQAATYTPGTWPSVPAISGAGSVYGTMALRAA